MEVSKLLRKELGWIYLVIQVITIQKYQIIQSTLKNQRHHCGDYRGRCEDPPAWERGTPAGTIGNSWTEEAMMSWNWWCLSSLFTPNYVFFLNDDDLELLIIVIMLHTQYCVLLPSDGVTSSPKLLHARPAVLGQGLLNHRHNVFFFINTLIQLLTSVQTHTHRYLITNTQAQRQGLYNHKHEIHGRPGKLNKSYWEERVRAETRYITLPVYFKRRD